MHHAMGAARRTTRRSGLAMLSRLGNRSANSMNSDVMTRKDARNPAFSAMGPENHSANSALKCGLSAPSPTIPPKMATAFCPTCTTVK